MKGTIDYALVYSKSDTFLEADADFASNTGDKKLISGFVFKSANGCISWVSRKQKTAALSSSV